MIEDLPSNVPVNDPHFIALLNKRLRAIAAALQGGPAAAPAAGSSTSRDAYADTHAKRLANYPAYRYQPGTMLWETDRTAQYQVQQTGAAYAWTYIGGTMEGATAARPTDLGASDAGFRFYDATIKRTQEWDGSAWDWYRSPDSVDAAGMLRSTAMFQTGELSGPGVEVQYNPASSGLGYVACYDRTAAVYIPLRINGLSLRLNDGSGGNVYVGSASDDGSGAKVQVSGAVNVTGGYKVNGTTVLSSQQAGVGDVSGSAGATYGANEQILINTLIAQLNALLARARAAGWLAT